MVGGRRPRMAGMKPMSLVGIAGTLALLCSAAAYAADAAPAAPPAPEPGVARPVESADPKGKDPVIQRTVIEDRSAHIEELRVRGQLQKVTVDPKGSAPGYEIIVGGGEHEFPEGMKPTRGAVGKRVWNIFRF
jgi:hypothetical protein